MFVSPLDYVALKIKCWVMVRKFHRHLRLSMVWSSSVALWFFWQIRAQLASGQLLLNRLEDAERSFWAGESRSGSGNRLLTQEPPLTGKKF